MVTPASGDKQGTPTSLLLSIVSAIVVFALAEIQNSFILGEAFSMRYVLLSYVGLGLTLAFFWKRLEKSPFLKISAALYLFGLWVSLFVTTLAPILLAGESPVLQRTLIQQFGLGFVAMSGLSLMLGLLQKQKMSPGLLFSALGALGLLMTSGGSFIFKAKQYDDDLITSQSHSGKKEAAVSEKEQDEGEEISAHGLGHQLSGNEDKDEAADGEHDVHGTTEHADDAEGHPAPATHGHEVVAPKPSHGRNEERRPHVKALTEKNRKRGFQLAAKALSDDRDEGHEPAPEKLRHSADDKEDVPARRAMPSKPRTKKVKTASLDQAFPAVEPRANPKGEQAVHWDYDAGDASPEHWGELADPYRLCSVGQQQSPINIPSAWPLLDDIDLDYKLTTVSIVDNGHAIVFNVGDQNYATIAGHRYKLLQFHIHTPSEHWIDGRLSPMEIHFVHKDEKNRLAVIGVMVEPGTEQKTMSELWGYVPQAVNLPASPRGKLFNIASILPTKPKVYRYRGSLTTPPCSENVLWSVASDKINLSPAQIDAFKLRYRNNARPLQKRQASLK